MHIDRYIAHKLTSKFFKDGDFGNRPKWLSQVHPFIFSVIFFEESTKIYAMQEM